MRVEIDWPVERAFTIAKLGHHPENRKPSASKKLRRWAARPKKPDLKMRGSIGHPPSGRASELQLMLGPRFFGGVRTVRGFDFSGKEPKSSDPSKGDGKSRAPATITGIMAASQGAGRQIQPVHARNAHEFQDVEFPFPLESRFH
jgi:hypothetical protein